MREAERRSTAQAASRQPPSYICRAVHTGGRLSPPAWLTRSQLQLAEASDELHLGDGAGWVRRVGSHRHARAERV
eukprot:COSAG01_NODE_3163_length_6477_cov_140.457981_6_plen_75_part_00